MIPLLLSAFAQDGLDPDDAEIITVVGAGPDVRDQYAGSAVILDEAAIEAAAPLSANDVLRTATGVNIVDEEGLGLRVNIGVRGLNPSRSRKVLVLEDGVPISLAPYGEPDAYWSPPIERMSRLEIVKGSGTIQFGPQTIGGVVNYVTRDPGDGVGGRASVRLGSFGFLDAVGSVSAGRGGHGVRLDAFHKRYAGPRTLNLGATDLSLKAMLSPAPGHTVRMKFGAYQEGSGASYLGLTQAQFEQDPRLNPVPHDHFALTRLAGHVTWQARIADVTMTTQLYGHRINRAWARQDYERADTGATYERAVSGAAGPLNDGSTLYFLDTTGIRDRAYTVAGLEERGSWGWRHGRSGGRLDFGARLHGEISRDKRLTGAPATSVASGTLTADELRRGGAVAAWAEHRFVFFDRLRVTPGMRFEAFWYERTPLFAADTAEIAPANGGFTGAALPALSASFDPIDGLTVYGGLHRGFAPPRTKDAIDARGALLDLPAEHSWNGELGLRGTTLGLRGEITAFIMDFDNQVIAPTESGGAVSGSDALLRGVRTRHLGAEAQVTVDPGEMLGWSGSMPLQVGYTLTHATFQTGPWAGRQLPYAPNHLFDVSAGWASVADGPRADLRASWTSAQFADNDNQALGSPDGMRGLIPAFTTLDARVAWRVHTPGPTLDVSLSAKNLLDTPYIASRAPAGIQPAGFRQILAGLDASW